MASSFRGEARLQTMPTELFPVPLTLEGASVLHQMARFRWPEWRKLAPAERSRIVAEATPVLHAAGTGSQSALYSVLGHKGDLMLVHFRNSFDELKQIELELARTALSDYLEITKSYLSVVELGLYESSVKLLSGAARARRGAAFGGVEQGNRGGHGARRRKP